MESWADKVRREHPWWWRWTALKDRVRRAWDWIWDAPYWHQTGGDLELRGLRTGRVCEESDD